MSSDSKNSKRRRYVRYAVDIKARLLLRKSSVIDCTILDFCSAGFFLGLTESVANIPLDKAIKVQFTLPGEFVSENFEIDAKVTHVSTNGLGVEVVNMPEAAFDALKNQANFGSKPDASTGLNIQQNCKNALKQLFDELLPPLLGRFFESIDDDLEQANRHSEYFENRSAFDDFITGIKLQRQPFISEFCSLIIAQVEMIDDGESKKDEVIYDNSLSLVEKDDFEDWLNMSAIIRRLKNNYDEEVGRLDRELSRVFGIFERKIKNPISPASLCDNFREVLMQLDANKKIRKAIYLSFEKTLDHGLPGLYKRAGSILEKFESAKPSYPGANAVKNDHSNDKSAAVEDRSQYLGGDHSEFLTALEFSKPKAKIAVGKASAKLLDIVREASGALSENSAQHLGGDHLPINPNQLVFDADEVLAAFLQIQRTIGKTINLSDSQTLQSQLVDALKRANGQTKSLSDNDVRQLDVHDKFFETLVDDSTVSSELKPYLERLHLPLLSLPFQGDDFLESESHPVRDVLNRLAVLESAVKNNRVVKNNNIKKILDEAIARIADESIGKPEVFAEVGQELDDITKQIAKSRDLNIKRIVDACEGQQKLEMARREVQSDIDKRIAGRAVPSVIPQLLNCGWQHLLVIAELNTETNPEEKPKYLKIIDDLIFWLHEQDSFLTMQVSTISQALGFIKENLSSVCTNLFELDAVVEELNAVLIGAGTPIIRKAIQKVKIPAAKNSDDKTNHLIEEDIAAEIDELIVGEWLMIWRDSSGFEPMKLVWMGDVLELYVFVNQDGLNKLELNKVELAEQMRGGNAYRTENRDLPLVDRATNAMLQKMHEKLIHNATHDTETDLLTRDEFIKQLRIEMSKIGSAQHMLCHLDMPDFRVITNVCGDAGGIQLIKTLAELIRGQLSEHDLFARLGHQTLALLLKDFSQDRSLQFCRSLIKIIADARFQWQEKSYPIVVSMGLVTFSANCYDISQLLQQADAASMSAERIGQNQVLLFADDDENLKRQNKLYEWMGNIDKVFSEQRLFMRCQMIASIDPGNLSHQHYEILLGIKDEEGKVIPPDYFIPAVERSKRMPEIDQWVITNVFAWIEEHPDMFNQIHGFSINLSGQSINSEAFLEFLVELLKLNRVPGDKITFEVTETVAAENLNFTKKFIKTIKQFGCKFSLDDFGSGYSSYSYLKNLNIDYLKIDGAFVKDILNNKADIAIVKSMNEIGHSLGLETIAEYVESAEIRQVLQEIGVDYGQGYGIHKPMPISELVIEAPKAETFSFEDTEFWGF